MVLNVMCYFFETRCTFISASLIYNVDKFKLKI